MSTTNLEFEGYPTTGSQTRGIKGPTVYLPIIVGGVHSGKLHYARASLIYADGREVDKTKYPLSQQAATGALQPDPGSDTSGCMVFNFQRFFIKKSGQFCIKVEVMREDEEAHTNIDTIIGAAINVA